MEAIDEVDYDESDSDFGDLEVDNEEEESRQTSAVVTEEGEATPEAAGQGASSDLEEGEFLADSQSMHLEVEEIPGRQQEVKENSSDEERRKRRRRLSPERRLSQPDAPSRDERQGSWDRKPARHSEEGISSLRQRGPGYGAILDQGWRQGLHDHRPYFEAGALPGSLAPPPVRAIEMDLATFLRPPSPLAATRPGPIPHPGHTPPLPLRGASNLLAHNGRGEHRRAQVPFGQQLRPDHRRQHLQQSGHPPNFPPVTREIVLDASGSIRFVDRPPQVNLSPFAGPEFCPDNSRQILAGVAHEFHRGPLRQGSGVHSPPSNFLLNPKRSSPHPRGLTGILEGPLLRAPLDSRGNSIGKLESLRSQLGAQESQGGLMPRQHREIVPPPADPPTKQDALTVQTISRSKSDTRILPFVKRLESATPLLRCSTSTAERPEDTAGATKAQRSFPGRKSLVKMPALEDTTPKTEMRSEGGSDVKCESKGVLKEDSVVPLKKEVLSLEDRLEGKAVVSEGLPAEVPLEERSSIRHAPEAIHRTEKRLHSRVQDMYREEAGGSCQVQSKEDQQCDAAESASASGEHIATGLQAHERSHTAKIDEEAKERDSREKEMRARALQILEAGKARKRKEREDEGRKGSEEGATERNSVHGSKRSGRDAEGQRMPRNWRRHASSDKEEGQRRSGSREKAEMRPEPSRVEGDRDPAPHKQNGRKRGMGGTRANAVPLGETVWSHVGDERERSGGDGPKAEPSSRRVVVGLSRTPGLPHFAVRERGPSPGPPGFERSARAGRSESKRDLADQRAGSGRAMNGIHAKHSSRTLAVDNLPGYFKTGHIADIFKRYGPIHLIRQLGGSSAEITFRNEEHAKAARANTHRMIKLEGRELIVNYKAPVPV